MRPGFKEIALVGAGGICGSLLRHGTNLLHQTLADQPGIFTAVLFENIIGSYLIGLFYLLLIKRTELNTRLFLFLITGLLGSYTTYSGFKVEALMLMQESFLLYLGYIGIQVIVGILAVFAGIRTGMRLRRKVKQP